MDPKYRAFERGDIENPYPDEPDFSGDDGFPWPTPAEESIWGEPFYLDDTSVPDLDEPLTSELRLRR